MKKTSTIAALLLSSNMAFALDFSSFTKDILGEKTSPSTKVATDSSNANTSNLTNSVVRDGLKSALKIGVDYGVKELSKKDGYLKNKNVRIPLPGNLAKAEGLIRAAGGDKIADDLIDSMNAAATQAAPKTASIFMDAVENMSMEDAKEILAGGDDAATKYFEKHTSNSLQEMIKPIVQKSMQDNSVAKYYDSANDFYANNIKDRLQSSSVMGMAKSFGADEYLPSESDEKLDDFVTNKAISGLFKMIASKESEIRKEPVAQTTALLKKVFAN